MRASRIGDVSERFHQRYILDVLTGCWNWVGPLNNKGYGVIAGKIYGKRYVGKGTNMLAHRVSWILHNGDIPSSNDAHGTVVRHKCDNPRCVNPEHLVLGTQADNVKDMDMKGRRVTVTKNGAEHVRSVFTQDQIDHICSTIGETKALAEKYKVSVSAIKNVRARNGFGSSEPKKFSTKKPSQDIIDHIRSTPPGTRGLTKLYGLSKTAISNIRKGLTYS